MLIEIKHFKTDSGGEFVIEESGNRAGELAYTLLSGKKISIDHTFVEKPFRGAGMGKSLVRASVEYARQSGLKICPLCPFAKVQIESNFPDVLEEGES
ncbi:MAG: N-acetyltransferase [Pyrinomonadaceae bacterium]|nr:N-acetyltransferase [Pyrinomonadaceae bacterium]MCX7638846.1 N-acetyltransferase [Pyrinomonadaceae bacterium]MDW8305018.1 GNAT family N-acetyltransferase [Acidobacteriota bacterium]